jgi:hypothetical protein
MKRKLEDLLEVNIQLQDEQQMLRCKYDQVSYILTLHSKIRNPSFCSEVEVVHISLYRMNIFACYVLYSYVSRRLGNVAYSGAL